MFDRAALFLLDERERLFPRAFLGDRADGDLVEYLPARRIAEIAGEDRRILGERDLGEPAADDRLADILGEPARALRFGVGFVDPRLEARDRHRILDRGIDEIVGSGGAVIIDISDVGIDRKSDGWGKRE